MISSPGINSKSASARFSLVKNLDIRLRILLLPILLINILLIDPENAIQAGMTIVITLGLFLMSGISLWKMIKRIMLIYPMILFFSLPLLLGDTAVGTAAGPANIGRSVFLTVQIKYLLTVLLLFSLSAGISAQQFIRVMQFYKFPDWMLAVLQYVAHLLSVLGAEYQRLKSAYVCRATTGSFHLKIKTVFGMMYVLTIRTIERSERIFFSMVSRGFTGKIYLEKLPSWHLREAIILSGALSFTLYSIFAGSLT